MASVAISLVATGAVAAALTPAGMVVLRGLATAAGGRLLPWAPVVALADTTCTPPPTTSGGGTPPPTTSGGGTPPPTTSGGGTPPPTTSGGGTPPPTTSGGGTPPPTTSGGGTCPPPDTTAPILTLPPNMTVNATSPTGAVVIYTVSATDPDNTASQLVISCTPPSGSIFPPGTTTVTCTASDPAGNMTSGSFTVTVMILTTTSLASSINPVAVGQSVTYTATVSPTPTGGSVGFTDNGLPVAGCSPVPLSGASASCTEIYASTVSHNVVATYSGSGNFLGSSSPALTEVVTATPCSTLAGCNLSGTTLTNANLAGANLSTANLLGTNLSSANLAGADLSGANLNGANLSGANLTGANLTNANLTSADLTGATLAGAVTTGANFNKVIWSNTICPDGTNSNSDMGTCIGHL